MLLSNTSLIFLATRYAIPAKVWAQPWSLSFSDSCWEVLNGVGVDGVGGIFFLAFLFFFVLFAFLLFSLFFLFVSRFSPILVGHKQTTAIYRQNVEFHSDPGRTDPVQNFSIMATSVSRFGINFETLQNPWERRTCTRELHKPKSVLFARVTPQGLQTLWPSTEVWIWGGLELRRKRRPKERGALKTLN